MDDGQSPPLLVKIEMTEQVLCATNGRTLVNTTRAKTAQDTSIALDRFLAGVERRAFRMAMMSTGSHEDALDIVQDAMLRLAKRYARRDTEQWGPLFHRIVQSVICDWYRRTAVRNRFRIFFGQKGQGDHVQESGTAEAPIEARFASGEPEPDAQLQTTTGHHATGRSDG